MPPCQQYCDTRYGDDDFASSGHYWCVYETKHNLLRGNVPTNI